MKFVIGYNFNYDIIPDEPNLLKHHKYIHLLDCIIKDYLYEEDMLISENITDLLNFSSLYSSFEEWLKDEGYIDEDTFAEELSEEVLAKRIEEYMMDDEIATFFYFDTEDDYKNFKNANDLINKNIDIWEETINKYIENEKWGKAVSYIDRIVDDIAMYW